MKIFHPIESSIKDEFLAVADIHQQISAHQNSFSLLFFSSKYDKAKFTSELKMKLSHGVIAVSTAGEISNGIFQEHTVSGLSLNLDLCDVNPYLIADLSELDESNIGSLSDLVSKINSNKPNTGPLKKTVCLLLVDGLSGAEEKLTEILGDILGDIPIVGGSTGDGLEFKETAMYFNGQTYQNAALLLFVSTDVPFEIIKTQHFSVSEKKLVITAAQPEKRTVIEIDGISAAEAYATLLGLQLNDLNAQVFSKSPLALNVGGKCYLRSIRGVNSDGSLTFYSAIDIGLVLSIALRKDIVGTTQEDILELQSKLGTETCSVVFECILRRLEVIDSSESVKNGLFKIYKSVNAVGFHTYGEQIGKLHINQTLLGVMFGSK